MVHNTIQDNEKIKKLEQIHMTRVSHTDSALSFHLMPPSGWLNDPNGLCQLHGTYHIFFQYSPYSAIGKGDKYWGHYETKDFIRLIKEHKVDHQFLRASEIEMDITDEVRRQTGIVFPADKIREQ